MNCIDTVEGLIISVLKEFFSGYCSLKDDSEYALNVKSILKAAENFVREHKEIIGEPEILIKILYEHARGLWIADMMKNHHPEETDMEKEREYYTYYFDHLYAHGVYPP